MGLIIHGTFDFTIDDTENPVNPLPETDPKYISGYRKDIVMPQGGDALSLNSSWNENGDSCLPYIFENSKGWKILLDLDEENAIRNGLYIVRLKVDACPITPSDKDPIRLKIQFSEKIAEGKRFWNLKTKSSVSKFLLGQNYYFDLNSELLARGLEVTGDNNARCEILYLYAHTIDYSTGKLCIRTDGGGNFKRTGDPWLPEGSKIYGDNY